MEENTPSKVKTFLSSAVSKILNLVMILVIIALAGVVVFFWNKNQLLEQENDTLQDRMNKFEEMNNQAKVENPVVKKNVEVEENVVKNNNETIIVNDSKNIESASSDSVGWKTYKSDKYNFEVQYPNNWKVEIFKTYSQFPDLGPVDCNKTPAICKFEMIRFTDENQNNFFGITENYDAKKEYNSIVKKSILMKDMIDGCLVTYSISSKNQGFLMHTFLSGDLIQDEKEKAQFQKKCENNELESVVDLAVKTFKVY